MSKFLLAAGNEIIKQQFDFRIAEVGDQKYIIDLHSLQAAGFGIMSDGMDVICEQMNRIQSWGRFKHEHLEKYKLI